MSETIREEALSLLSGITVEAFEDFMTASFMPHMVDRFKGPTRVSRADLQSISLLHSAKSARRFLLVTVWQGAPNSVMGASFEHTRMNTNARTDALLLQLAALAKRAPEKVYVVTTTLRAPER